jgi:hypothetical protein
MLRPSCLLTRWPMLLANAGTKRLAGKVLGTWNEGVMSYARAGSGRVPTPAAVAIGAEALPLVIELPEFEGDDAWLAAISRAMQNATAETSGGAIVRRPFLVSRYQQHVKPGVLYEDIGPF